jgi:hypothetical protein
MVVRIEHPAAGCGQGGGQLAALLMKPGGDQVPSHSPLGTDH